MVRQVTMRREGPTTALKGAHERLLPIMDAHMRLQVSLLRETLATALELTDERLSTVMGPLVDLEAACARVTFATNIAHEGLVAGMDQFVSLKMPLCDEPLVTVFK